MNGYPNDNGGRPGRRRRAKAPDRMGLHAKTYMGFFLAFLYLPILVLIAYSFNESKSRLYFTGFTFDWYRQLFSNSLIASSLRATIVIAAISSVAATVLGTAAAIGISNMRKWSRAVVMNLTYLPIINPEIVTGVSMMLLFGGFQVFFAWLGDTFGMQVGFEFGYATLILAHITFSTPYVILNVMPKLRQMDKNVYEAALDLGCNEWQALTKVVVPDIRPGIIAGFLTSVTMSLDDFVISYFVSGPTSQTLPITIFSMTRRKVSPEINALSTILFVVVLTVLAVVNIHDGRRERQKLRQQHAAKRMAAVLAVLLAAGFASARAPAARAEAAAEALALSAAPGAAAIAIAADNGGDEPGGSGGEGEGEGEGEEEDYGDDASEIDGDDASGIDGDDASEIDGDDASEYEDEIDGDDEDEIDGKYDDEDSDEDSDEEITLTAPEGYYERFRGAGLSINVYNWGDYISDGTDGMLDVNGAFTEATGIKVNFSTFATNEELYSKLRSGYASYDVVIPSDYMIGRLADEGLLQTLDYSNIPLAGNIDEQFRDPPYDPGGAHSVPYTWGYVGIIYNKTLVYDEDEMASWDALWDEKYLGDILMFSNSRDSFAIAQARLGYSLNTTDEGELRECLELLKAQKPLVQAYVMDEIFDKMLGGEAAIAPYYAGDALTMISQNEDLGFSIPQECVNLFVDAMCVPANARQKEAAEMYINFMLEPEVGAANSEYIGYATPNTEAYEILDDEMRESPIAFPPDESLANTENFSPLPAEASRLMDGLWTELLSDDDTYNRMLVPILLLLALAISIGLNAMRARRRARRAIY